jgi:SAM-dependent methyltransferase
MAAVAEENDAYGQEVHAYWQGNHDVMEVIEREDGAIDVGSGLAVYFAPYEAWLTIEQEAMKLVRGRVLDVGCGPGRVALYLQELGHEVVGIDNSPLAIEVARQRGVRHALIRSITQADARLGRFETIVMFGNNFGLFGSAKRARWLLRRWRKMTTPDSVILAETRDPYHTADPLRLAYHAYNRQRGRLAGQVRIRVRFRMTKGPWFDYLFVSRSELQEILSGTGWQLSHTIDSDGPQYVAVIKQSRGSASS